MGTRQQLTRPRWAGLVASAMALGGDVLYVAGLSRSDQIDPFEPIFIAIVVLIAVGAAGLFFAPLMRHREAAIFVSGASSLMLLVLGVLAGPFGLPVIAAAVLTLVSTDWVTKESG